VTVVTSGPGYVRETPQDPSPTWADDGGVEVVRLPTPWPRPWKALRTAWTRCVRPRRMKWWHDDARRRALALHAARPFDVVVTRHEPDRVAWIGHALAATGVRGSRCSRTRPRRASPAALRRRAARRERPTSGRNAGGTRRRRSRGRVRASRASTRGRSREAAPRIVVPHVGGVAAARDEGVSGDRGREASARPSDGIVLVHTGLG
jgi:hypothetical protein